MVGALVKRCKLLLIVLFTALLAGCGSERYQAVAGATMGTYYRVQASCPVRLRQRDIDARLRQFNTVFSTYDPRSEVSQLNLADLSNWRTVSGELMVVLQAAKSLSERSAGAFDPTIGQLVELWGFGSAEGQSVPAVQALADAAAQTGFAALELDPGVPAIRARDRRRLDLSAIAKGRAVDELILALQAMECDAALVDIGGEIRVFGRSAAQRPWRLAVEQPGELVVGSEPLPVLEFTEGAVATSGDYRNYREVDGQRLSHLIDPRSGRPVTHGLASVTVWHKEAMWADGYATAINVLGPEAGQALANEAKLAVAMLIRRSDGLFEPWMSTAFAKRFGEP